MSQLIHEFKFLCQDLPKVKGVKQTVSRMRLVRSSTRLNTICITSAGCVFGNIVYGSCLCDHRNLPNLSSKHVFYLVCSSRLFLLLCLCCM